MKKIYNKKVGFVVIFTILAIIGIIFMRDKLFGSNVKIYGFDIAEPIMAKYERSEKYFTPIDETATIYLHGFNGRINCVEFLFDEQLKENTTFYIFNSSEGVNQYLLKKYSIDKKNKKICINFNDTKVDQIKILAKSFDDKNFVDLYGDELFNNINKNQMYIMEAVEEKKTIDTALEICEIMTNIPAKRNAKLISFGGGIVQDVTGFVANILYRGIHWRFYPTTLLAACDSCIGGKTSLNYKKFKNLLGTFYPPDEINICTPFFKTLSERDFQSGLGEVVKFNVMFGEAGIKKMEDNIDALLRREDAKLAGFVGCPEDAADEIKEISDYISGYKGGYGAVRDVIRFILEDRGQWKTAICRCYKII